MLTHATWKLLLSHLYFLIFCLQRNTSLTQTYSSLLPRPLYWTRAFWVFPLCLCLSHMHMCVYIFLFIQSHLNHLFLYWCFLGFFFFLVEYNATWSSSRKFYFLGSILRMGLLAYFSSAHISLSGSRTSLHLSFTLLLDILCMCKEGSGFLLWTGISTSITLIALCHLT